jgi:hypothetical protein
MTYREDLYQQHGFPPPKTWEEWKETGKKIKAAVAQGRHCLESDRGRQRELLSHPVDA